MEETNDWEDTNELNITLNVILFCLFNSDYFNGNTTNTGVNRGKSNIKYKKLYLLGYSDVR
jgi:hypothetical protein